MSDKPEGMHASDILIGTFMLLFGACFVLAGGACAIFWIGGLLQNIRDGMSLVMLLVSLGSVAFGLFTLYHGLRVARGRYRNG